MKKEVLNRIGKWLIDGDTGLSSLSLLAVYLGGEPSHLDYPHDPSDFKRCLFFLELMPIQEQLDLLFEMSRRSSAWQKLQANWQELVALYREEADKKSAPKLYQKMQQLNL